MASVTAEADARPWWPSRAAVTPAMIRVPPVPQRMVPPRVSTSPGRPRDGPPTIDSTPTDRRPRPTSIVPSRRTHRTSGTVTADAVTLPTATPVACRPMTVLDRPISRPSSGSTGPMQKMNQPQVAYIE